MSNACDSQLSSGFSAALIPPAAATECERTGWTFETIATVAPVWAAASAARCPASPAPMIRTSWEGIGEFSGSDASLVRNAPQTGLGEQLSVMHHATP